MRLTAEQDHRLHWRTCGSVGDSESRVTPQSSESLTLRKSGDSQKDHRTAKYLQLTTQHTAKASRRRILFSFCKMYMEDDKRWVTARRYVWVDTTLNIYFCDSACVLASSFIYVEMFADCVTGIFPIGIRCRLCYIVVWERKIVYEALGSDRFNVIWVYVTRFCCWFNIFILFCLAWIFESYYQHH